MGRAIETGSALEIRPVQLGDAAGLQLAIDSVARERRYLATLEGPPLDAVRAFLEQLSRTGVQVVALDGRAVVGWCDIQVNPREGFRHSGVLGMGVLRLYRRRGLGRRLLREALDCAVARGVLRVELEVFAGNTAALALYESLGFRHEGVKVDARRLDDRSENIVCMAWLGGTDSHRVGE